MSKGKEKEKMKTTVSSSSTSELQTTTAVSTAVLPLGGDYIDGESMNPTVTTSRTVTTIATLDSSATLDPPIREYFTSLYETLYKFNTNPIEAAEFKGAKYGQAIMDAVNSGKTLAGLTKDQQIYMLRVMKNILYPKSKSPEEGGSIPNLEFLKSLPKDFTDSLKEAARSVLEDYIQDQDSSSNSSTTSTTTTSVSTTSSLEKPSSSSGSSSTSELQTTTAVSTAVLPLGGDYID
ncbi:MAG: hypothetical protein LW599_02330 [Rickettsiaceae bacterium]|nr:hypothetical protein [Rickettsiaceae bacterium]